MDLQVGEACDLRRGCWTREWIVLGYGADLGAELRKNSWRASKVVKNGSEGDRKDVVPGHADNTCQQNLLYSKYSQAHRLI